MNHIYRGDQPVAYIPYTYIIGWKTHKVWYFGSESASISKTAHPQNLWINNHVKEQKHPKYKPIPEGWSSGRLKKVKSEVVKVLKSEKVGRYDQTVY